MGMSCTLRAVAGEDGGGSPATPAAVAGPAGVPPVSLEKTWHGLHFLLTGSAGHGVGPLGFLLAGGNVASADEPGTRVFSPEQARALDAALSGISDDRLWERFDPARMADEFVYPLIWDEPEGDLRDEYLGHFRAMKELIHRAAAAGLALVVSIG